MSLDSINIAVNSLKNSIEQTGQSCKLAHEETAAYEKARNKWAGFTALSLLITAAPCFIPGGSIALTAACVVCIGGGAISTVGCGCKTCKEWNNMNDSDEGTKKQARTETLAHADRVC
ncbi:hypothetical protein FLAG1_09030 [Fusarium langsethiae]|uniref:Uncharacterized protein n=1 Tax=Fusarium langsethiae TaxID=179993 RepID=A0A0N0DCF1_FUSLA|nr:hypothetical protein FLAG1_09030 [Fusarium langsethiae]GKU16624.1 unnamed protein product [Fusarium langsethiae]